MKRSVAVLALVAVACGCAPAPPPSKPNMPKTAISSDAGAVTQPPPNEVVRRIIFGGEVFARLPSSCETLVVAAGKTPEQRLCERCIRGRDVLRGPGQREWRRPVRSRGRERRAER
jgi:hypothetical protein